MKPPANRPTPKVTPMPSDPAMPPLPKKLTDRLDAIDRALDDLKIQQNAANGEMCRMLETWREDLLRKVSSTIEEAIKEHIADYHANGAIE